MQPTHKTEYLLKNTQKSSPYKTPQKHLKIIRHTKTNSAAISQKKNKSSSRNSMYSTQNNSEVAVQLVLAKVDLSKIRSSLSIPFMNKITERVCTMQENKNNKIQVLNTEVEYEKKNTEIGVELFKDGEFQDQFVLNPAKTHKYQTQPNRHEHHAQSRYKTLGSSGEKVVILSSSYVKPQLEYVLKKPSKPKTLQKIPKLLLDTAYFSQKTKPVIIPKFKKSPAIKILQDEEPEDAIISEIAKQITQVNLQKFIKSDRRLLKLFPKIDLELLIYKIKKQEKCRKAKNIQKWKHFDYRNFNSLK